MNTVVSRLGCGDWFTISTVREDEGTAFVVLEAFEAKDEEFVPEEVAIDEFLKQFVVRDPKEKQELHAAWPSGRIAKQRAADIEFRKGWVTYSLGSMSALIEQHFRPAECLQVYVKPSRRVVSCKDIPSQGFVLGFDTLHVRSFDLGSMEELPSGNLEIMLVPPCNHCKYFVGPPKSDMCSPAFMVNTTADPKKANMAWTRLSVSAFVAFDFVGPKRPSLVAAAKKAPIKAVSKQQGKKSAASASPEDSNEQLIVHLPLLINIQPLRCGDELLILQASAPAKRAASKPAVAITPLDLIKKPRAAK